MVPHQVYGDPSGRPVFYLHGTPGAPAEALFLAAAAQANGLRLLALDRRQLNADLTTDDYLAQLRASIVRLAGAEPVHLLGFSIGASLALRLAARLPEPAAGLWLVSAAAPLELPGSLLGMGAGRHTFALAQGYPRLFRLLAAYQGWLARHRPELLLRLLFQGARGADAELLAQEPLREQLKAILQHCFAQGASAYRRDVQCYVQPWAECLAQVRAPVQLWHGEQDTWAPAGMPRNLLAGLGAPARLHWLPGAGHYSCLIDSASALSQRLAASFPD